MSWHGPPLGTDDRDLVAMLDALARDHGAADGPSAVAAVREQLVSLGVWTLGTAEECGGAGAGAVTVGVALERLGRSWPALGWASVQSQAAIDLLERAGGHEILIEALHEGRQHVAVVAAGSTAASLTTDGERVSGRIARVDTASPQSHVVVLDGDGAWLVPSAACDGATRPSTGLSGSATREVAIDAGPMERLDVDPDSARTRLLVGAAALACGVAGAAADAAAGYAAERRQFGGPLTELPAVRAALERQRTTVGAALSAVLQVHDLPGARAVAHHACDAAVEVCAAALQSHGGYGYLVEYPAERFLRDAVSLRAVADVSAVAGGGRLPAAEPARAGVAS